MNRWEKEQMKSVPICNGSNIDFERFVKCPLALFEVTLMISNDAKLLYVYLLNRASLSMRNSWYDSNGNVYVYCTIKEISRVLHCGNQKAIKVLAELCESGFVKKKIKGQGKPAILYPQLIFSDSYKLSDQKCDNHTARNVKNDTSKNVNTEVLELSKSDSNNTDATTLINNDSSIIDGKQDDQEWRAHFYESLDVENMKSCYPYDANRIDEILQLCVDVMCSDKKRYRINGEYKSGSVVKHFVKELDGDDLQLVLKKYEKNAHGITNMESYLLTLLWNAHRFPSHYGLATYHDAQLYNT